jgi:hypothetical protein
MTGYQSKRAAARDKLLDDDDTQVYQDDTLTIAYQSGYYDGKKAAAQEPTKYSFKAHWEEDGCIGVVAAIERLDGGVHLLKGIIDAPQPAQEPVGVVCVDTSHAHIVYGSQYLGRQPDKKTAMFFKDCEVGEQLYTLPQQRPWVGLTDGERLEAAGIDAAGIDAADEWFWEVVEAIEAKLKEKNT